MALLENLKEGEVFVFLGDVLLISQKVPKVMKSFGIPKYMVVSRSEATRSSTFVNVISNRSQHRYWERSMMSLLIVLPRGEL